MVTDSKPEVSLPEVHASVPILKNSNFLKRLLTFTGPAFMVAVGYMDPGNWATDLAGGSRFGYRLIWVILLSNIMAIVLQTLAARLGIITGRDLAQACREHYPRPIVWVLWVLTEIAIAATDLAEVLGSAIGLKLLFGSFGINFPILWGVVVTAFDVLAFLVLQSFGIRKMEALILTLIGTIGACFAVQMFFSRPALGAVALGFIPHRLWGEELYLAIGIIGATVMPHNLYLHSALVQSRAFDHSVKGLKEAARFNLVDSVVALNAAFFVNAAILCLAAAVFWKTGHTSVATLAEAHSLLDPLLGSKLSPILFALALLAAGQSSTITGTMAGQIVMEGFVNIKIRPWVRRLLTRAMAIVPAVLFILYRGEKATDDLLVLSQVVLSLQLSFAVIPLINFTSDRRWMGEFATSLWGKIAAWAVAVLIVALNGKLVMQTLHEGLAQGLPAVRYVLLPATVVLVPMLGWMILEPAWRRWRELQAEAVPTPEIPAIDTILASQYRTIGIALEVNPSDQEILAYVVPLARATGAELVLIHAVESATARFIGGLVYDEEARGDRDYLERVGEALRKAGLPCRVRMGAGEPENEIARIAQEEHLDLIVTGSHGHQFLGDLWHGSTVTQLRHRTQVPVLSIRFGRA